MEDQLINPLTTDAATLVTSFISYEIVARANTAYHKVGQNKLVLVSKLVSINTLFCFTNI